jgi:hypothetical protein
VDHRLILTGKLQEHASKRVLHFRGQAARLQPPDPEASSWIDSSLSPKSLEGFSGVAKGRHFRGKKEGLDQRARL